MNIGNLKIAEANLLKARSVDPENYQSDFVIGLMDALARQPADLKSARKHFLASISRLEQLGKYRTPAQDANMMAAINNAAIAEVRLRSYGSALERWRSILETQNPTSEIVQNLGRFSELSNRYSYLIIPSGITSRVSKLYGSIASASDRSYDPKSGWLYLMLIPETYEDKLEINPEENKTKIDSTSDPGETLRLFGFGTGFVVSKDKILTNKHVVDSSIEFQFKVNGSLLEGVSGRTLSTSSKWDLALIDCANINLPPLEWAPKGPRLGAPIRTLGYPHSVLLGESIKVTSGTFVGISRDGHYLYDSILNKGNSGGPAINSAGQVFAVNTFFTLTDMSYAGGVPSEAAIEFIKENKIPITADLSEVESTWEDVIEKVGKSTVQILCYATPEKAIWAGRGESDAGPGDNNRITPSNWNGVEDRWCMNCEGLNHIKCYNRSCKSGAIVSRKREPFTLPNGNTAYRWVNQRARCPTCDGKGRIKCPHCSSGLDPSL